ncbi:MAG: UvrD-helicase domain-containing protein [Pseudomonadota bacterium]
MKNVARSPLRDDPARTTAIAALDRSLLVEAGAGSGKTAVMAGRVAMLLAEGAAPRSIAAVTFTELAAGELLVRVRAFVDALVAGQMPAELAVALPDGLSAHQRQDLEQAARTIDQVTCSTIHGFCQRLILPYPVEANIDPGAGVMDRDNADQIFDALADQWLWAILDGGADSLLAQLVAVDAARSLTLVRALLGQVRNQRAMTTLTPKALGPLLDDFARDSAALQAFVDTQDVKEAETARRASCFSQMAIEVRRSAALPGHARLAQLQACTAHTEMCTADGSFRVFKTKGKWGAAAKEFGLKAAQGEPLFDQAYERVQACQQSWAWLKQEVAADVLVQLVAEMAPVLQDFQNYKRDAALLDFDDLIHSARMLLRDHDDVRRALGQRYAHVLVDEFQDTDPLQAEIFWRLCGDPCAGAPVEDWTAYAIRPGALFLVGDPKQAIYRFRGADIAAYTAAREVFARRGDVLSIATNFRSCAPILDFVNQRFAPCLGAEGQPGFTPLDAFHPAQAGQVYVAALEVSAAGEDGKASAEQQRDAEAEAVADMCAQLIGSRILAIHKGAPGRPCKACDIALLAPTGNDLWRYEEALERRGIAVATQAGKGFYRRQEVQDLIALCRVLADSRDTIALGALLRGPLVGLTEEALLDIVLELPRPAERPQQFGRLSVWTDPAHVSNEAARAVLTTLQALRRHMHGTSPHMLLSQAVDQFRVRPILLQRHAGRAERALANVDKFLAMSQAWTSRGLAAFAAAMTQAWTDESRAPEGQPDAQEDAVTLYTMHSSKGLEWPIVVPINTMTRAMGANSMFCERSANRLCCAVLGTTLPGYEDDHAAEAEELGRERVRLWYVAATRAQELLVLPRLDVAPAGSAWIALVNLGLSELPAISMDGARVATESPATADNDQARGVFEAEAAIVAASARPLRWRAPSRDEGDTLAVMEEETAELRIAAADEMGNGEVAHAVQGGRERGLVMHKLFEEVLNGETAEDTDGLRDRAAVLIAQVGSEDRLSAVEISACVANTLGLPAIAALRHGLVAEYCVYGAQEEQGNGEVVTAGIADAISFTHGGQPEVIIDWKSDVNPTAATIAHYRVQVGNYLALTGAKRGMIVLATSGRIIEI